MGKHYEYEKTRAEVASGFSRLNFAEGLISQLPETHEGRNTWMMNFGQSAEAQLLRNKRKLSWNPKTKACELTQDQLLEYENNLNNELNELLDKEMDIENNKGKVQTVEQPDKKPKNEKPKEEKKEESSEKNLYAVSILYKKYSQIGSGTTKISDRLKCSLIKAGSPDEALGAAIRQNVIEHNMLKEYHIDLHLVVDVDNAEFKDIGNGKE